MLLLINGNMYLRNATEYTVNVESISYLLFNNINHACVFEHV